MCLNFYSDSFVQFCTMSLWVGFSPAESQNNKKESHSRAWPENPICILWILATSASMTHFFYYVIFGLVPKIQSVFYGYSQQVRVWQEEEMSFSGLTRESTSILQFQPTIRCELPFFLIGFHCVSIWNSCHRHVFKLPYLRTCSEDPSHIVMDTRNKCEYDKKR